MNEFEDRKNIYFKRLNNFIKQYSLLTGGPDEIINIIYNPKDLNDLDFANEFLDYLENLINLYYCSKYENIDLENNKYAPYLVDYINSLKNNEFEEKYKNRNGLIIPSIMKNNDYEYNFNLNIDMNSSISDDEIKLLSEIYIDALRLFSDVSLLQSLLKEKCNIDINDDLDFNKLSLLLEKSNLNISKNNFDISVAKKYIEYSNELLSNNKKLELK